MARPGHGKKGNMMARRVVVTEFLSLDGVMEAPHEWHFDFWSDEMGTFKLDELFASDALLLGRVTYEGFAAVWPTMTDEAGFADRINSLPKYVVSTTLTDPLAWNNSTLITENVAEEVTKLKQEPGQEIQVAGSGNLIQTLMRHDLVDEYRLMVHPVVVGSGQRLFAGDTGKTTLRLAKTTPLPNGVIVLSYEPQRSA